jgi:hypothetical protein
MVFASAAGMTPSSSKQQALSALSAVVFAPCFAEERCCCFWVYVVYTGEKKHSSVYKFMPAAFASFQNALPPASAPPLILKLQPLIFHSILFLFGEFLRLV